VAERHSQQRQAVYTSWANTTNRAERTRAAREARHAKRLAAHGGDPLRAEAALKAEMIALARKSGEARRARAAEREARHAAHEAAWT
jgi:hypothetical protein